MDGSKITQTTQLLENDIRVNVWALTNHRFCKRVFPVVSIVGHTYPSTKYSPIIVSSMVNLRRTVNIGKLKKCSYHSVIPKAEIIYIPVIGIVFRTGQFPCL